MKNLFKQTRVIYYPHTNVYSVYYKTFLSWKHDCTYKVDTYLNDERAKTLALERAKALLKIVEIYRS